MRNAIRAIRRWKASHGDVERVAERKVCSLEAAISYLCNATLDKDTGFQGYEPEGVISRQPKKLKGKALSIGDKFLNRIFSSACVEVEYVISGVKRYRIVKDVLRLTKKGIPDLVMEIQ